MSIVSSGTFDETDIKFMKPATTLGGAITATEYSDNILHNFFQFIDDDLADDGGTLYLPFYVKNINPSEDIVNPRLLVFDDTPSPHTTLAIGWDPAQGNQSVQTIANQFTSPTGVVWATSPDPTRAAVLGRAVRRNNGYQGAWLRLTIAPGAEEFRFDGAEIFMLMDNLPGDAPNLVVPDVPDVIDVIGGGGTDINWIWKKILENIRYSNVSLFIHGGNIFGNHTTNPPTNAHSFLGFFPPTMRKLSLFCFGQNEAKNPVVKNSIRDFFGLNKTYYDYIHHNIHYFILDTSDNARVPYEEGSDQYEWFKKKLAESLTLGSVHWRIVQTNRCAYAATTSPAAKKYLDPIFRDDYHPIMQEGIDVCVQQTFNNYQVLHVLEYNSADPENPTTKFTDQTPNYIIDGQYFDKGTLFLVTGMSGADFDNIADTPAFLRYGDSLEHGTVDYRFWNHWKPQQKRLQIAFKNLLQKTVNDSITTITKR